MPPPYTLRVPQPKTGTFGGQLELHAARMFIPGETRRLPTLGCTAKLYRHSSEALHVHLSNDDEHRGFTIAVRTQPGDDFGAPHILEHTALCGSRRFPVRDPFFHMMRRSLQTFMNAMTFADLTCYPFATQVASDFANLLDVYLDAVFAPQLRREDFLQEGHRLERTADGRPQRQGVVFNEMKGAMDGTEAQVEQAVIRALLPDTCYRWNYGGEPAAIPDLDHAGLLARHRQWYVPANALFVSYGRLDPTWLHSRLEPYLAIPGRALPPPARQAKLPAQELDVPVPLGDGQEPEDTSLVGINWVVGDGADLDAALDIELLDRLLLGHAGAPLRLALESSGLGRSTGSSGVHGACRDLVFSAELDGVSPADYPRFAPLIDATLARCVVTGFAASEVTAALDQLELSRREISGDQYPFGLDLCLRVVQAWNLGGDPLTALDQDPAIARLRGRWEDSHYGPRLVQRLLIDNPHRCLVRARPDRTWHDQAAAAEAARADADVARLPPTQLAADAAALAARQAETVADGVLPTLTLSDIPRQRHWAAGEPGPVLWQATPVTNGLLHLVTALDIGELTGDDLDLLPVLTAAIGGTGVGAQGYAAWSANLNRRCAGLWAWHDHSALADDLARSHGLLVLESKGLATRWTEFSELIGDTLVGQRFDEPERLGELLDQDLSRLTDLVQAQGHRFAAAAAAARLGGAGSYAHRLKGMARLAWLRRTVAADDIGALGRQAAALWQRIAGLPVALAAIGPLTSGLTEQLAGRHPRRWAHSTGAAAPTAVFGPDQAFTTATAMSYHAMAWRTVPLSHPDAPALAVGAQVLTHGFLHPRFRERGGAYGAAASWQGASGIFGCSTFRDPRGAASLRELADAAAWLADTAHDDRSLREAILAVVAGIDAPASPAGEARSRFIADLRDFGPARLDPFRAAVLDTTTSAVREAARRWLAAPPARATVTDPATARQLDGWQVDAC